MTVFAWKKQDVENLLKDIEMVGDKRCCTKSAIKEDLQSILTAMILTKQETIYAATRGNLVYLTGRDPEST